MWEAIRSNRRRALLLIGLMGAILVGLGAALGVFIDPEAGLAAGAVVALGVWLVLLIVALAQGDRILLATAGTRPVTKADAPVLINVVEEMAIAAGLARPPAVYLMESEAPNAFAVGRKADQAAVVVTSGLLKRLDRDQLQGVVAHEIGHIHNEDVRFMTLAAVLLGSVTILSDVFFRHLMWGGGRRRLSSKGGGQAQVAVAVVAVLAAIVAPIAARLLYLACSRRREYLADACGARFSRYPEGLASALETIAATPARAGEVSRVMAPMFIVSPLRGSAALGLFATHPPTETRVRILRGMAGGAGWGDYERAFRQATGGRQHCLDGRTLAADSAVTIRPPIVPAGPVPAPFTPPAAEPVGGLADRLGSMERVRQVNDLLDRLADFLLVPCACGVQIKVPPELTRPVIRCPRCNRDNPLPHAEADPKGAGAAPSGAPTRQTVPLRRTHHPGAPALSPAGTGMGISPHSGAAGGVRLRTHHPDRTVPPRTQPDRCPGFPQPRDHGGGVISPHEGAGAAGGVPSAGSPTRPGNGACSAPRPSSCRGARRGAPLGPPPDRDRSRVT